MLYIVLSKCPRNSSEWRTFLLYSVVARRAPYTVPKRTLFPKLQNAGRRTLFPTFKMMDITF